MFDQIVGFTKTIIPLALMASESKAHSAFGLVTNYVINQFSVALILHFLEGIFLHMFIF